MVDMVLCMLFVKGALMGFSIAAPVGPIGIICIRRTLSHGIINGFVSGLGAASADACYGMIAAAGLTSLASLLVDNASLMRSGGGVFLIYLGIKTLMTRKTSMTNKPGSPVPGVLARSFTSVFFLTLANPMTIISFTAIFAGLGLGTGSGSLHLAIFLVIGVFSGSAVWWFILSSLFGLVKLKMTEAVMFWINRISGIIISIFGITAIGSLCF